jgi:PQQ-dependent catabolism-associated CXXCW motif protein
MKRIIGKLAAAFAVMAMIGGGAVVASTLRAKPANGPLFSSQNGYRTAEIRSATPTSIDGGKVISLDELEALLKSGSPILIDVIARDGGLVHWVRNGGKSAPVRRNIPGSVWMPLLGRADLPAPVETAQISAVRALTGHNFNRPLVIYCQADCWTSWNAARRMILAGFKNVYWFREGTDLWADAGLPLNVAEEL